VGIAATVLVAVDPPQIRHRLRRSALGAEQTELDRVEQGLPRRLDDVLVDADRGPGLLASVESISTRVTAPVPFCVSSTRTL
jgi:hypothetical protein